MTFAATPNDPVGLPPLEPPVAGVQPRVVRRRRMSAVGWIGLTMTLVVVAIALIGPLLTPHDPNALLGAPYGAPHGSSIFGFDYLGRDAFSRFLAGGRTAVLLAVLGCIIGGAAGLTLGLVAAFARGPVDALIAWLTEVMIGFPALVLMLLLVAGLGSSSSVLVLALAVIGATRITRIVRAAAREVRDAAYVEVAEARGERRIYIMFRELLPTVMPPFLVDAGVRIPASIILIAGLSFLGLGVHEPASDWGLTIAENRAGLTLQPWSVLGPIAALLVLMVGVNLAIDGFAGRSTAVGSGRVS